MITQNRWSDYLLEWMDRWPWAVPVAIGILYLIGFTGTWRPEPDAALYLNLGRNLAEGHGYTYHQVPHRLAYPGWPWVLSVLFYLTPSHAVFLGHVVLLLIGLSGLALMYRLMSLHTNRATALLMTAGLAGIRTYYQYCFEMRSDMMFMLGVMMTLAGYEGIVRRGEIRNGDARPTAARPNPRIDWPLLIGGLLVGTVTRPTMYPILAALMLAILWDVFRRRLSPWFLTVLVLPVAAGAAFLVLNPRAVANPSGLADYEDFVLNAMTFKRLGINILHVIQPMAGEAYFGLELPKGLNIIASVAALWAGLAMFRHRALWGLVSVFTLAMMAVSIVQARYFLPLLPMMVYGWWLGLRWINHRLPRRWGNLAFASLFVIGSFPNGAKVGDMFIEQRHRNPLTAFSHGRFASVDKVTAMLQQHVRPGEYVYAPRKTDKMFTFLARRNVLEPAQVHRVSPDTATVYVLTNKEFDKRVPFANRLGEELGRVQGKHDKEPWVLYRVK
jgi:hypothetical protein